jgi:DNA-binding transcriptional regulator YiaG
MTDWTPDTIKALKHDLGLSYSELAKLCGVSARSVRYWTDKTGARAGQGPSGSARVILDGLAKKAKRKAQIPARD